MPDVKNEKQGTKDFKKLLNCSKIIDEIFHERQDKIDAERRAEEERRRKEQAERDEIEKENAGLRDSLAGRISAVSNLQKSQSLQK